MTQTSVRFAGLWPPPWWLRLLLAAMLLYLLSQKLDLSAAREQLLHMQPLYLGLSLLLVIPNVLLQYLRWHTLVRSQLPDLPASRIWRSLWIGFPLGVVTPARLGEHARITCLLPASRTQLTTISLLDRQVGGVITSLVGAVALWMLPTWHAASFSGMGEALRRLLFVAGGAVLLNNTLLLLTLLMPGRLTGLVQRIPRMGLVKTWIKIRDALCRITPTDRLLVVFWSVLFYTTFILQLVLLIRGLGFSHPLLWAAASGTMFIKTLFPISPGDLGVRELVAAALFSTIGVAPEAAVAGSFMLYLMNVLLPAICGLGVLLLWRRQHQGDYS